VVEVLPEVPIEWALEGIYGMDLLNNLLKNMEY
jgi:hypothetical protein